MRTLKWLMALILCMIVGFMSYKLFFEFSVEMIRNEKVEFYRNDISSQFSSQLIFAMVIGFIPILYFMIQKFIKIRFLFDGAYVLLFILIFGGLSSIIRGVYIKQELMILTQLELNDNIQPSYSIDRLCFEYYLFLGFILGALISFLLLRFSKKTA